MASFGIAEAGGLIAVVSMIAAAVLGARGALAWRTRNKETAKVVAKLEDFGEREEINRLRHRDFNAFMEKLNTRRKRLGEAPLTNEYMRPQRYNLMYTVDAGDIDREALDKLRKRVESAAKEGDDPSMPPPIEP